MPNKDPVERGLHFATRLGAQADEDVTALAIDVYAMLDLLLGKGLLTVAEFQRARADSEQAMSRRGRRLRVLLGDDDHRWDAFPRPDIDCASLLHLCKARCCTFRFALSRQDLDAGVVRWDYEEPYMIAQKDGYCAHIDRATHGCTAYEHRPVPCRLFDCRDDRRIWIDFEQRIPAADPSPDPTPPAPTPDPT